VLLRRSGFGRDPATLGLQSIAVMNNPIRTVAADG
jgi:hypothetical protein